MPPSRTNPGLRAVHALESLPPAFTASLFLGGARGGGWRREVLQQLEGRGYDGIALIPEGRQGAAEPDSGKLLLWQEDALLHCDLILMWIPEESLQDFTVVESWGNSLRSGKLVLGTPLVQGPLIESASRRRVPTAHSLPDLVTLALQLIRPGAQRRGGERLVPLALWRSPSFQSWYRALTGAGHRLDGVELEWTHRSRGVARPPFLWAMRPRIQVRGERRQLSGEVVIGRADISATVLYHRPPGAAPGDTEVVMVREFRAAVRNRSGFAWMLPGGSAARASERTQDPRATAAQEVLEETGLHLPLAQFQPVPDGDRQLISSLVSHHAQLFRAELDPAQLASLREAAAVGRPFGATPSERCFVSVRRLSELLADPDLDWSQIGMLAYALSDL